MKNLTILFILISTNITFSQTKFLGDDFSEVKKLAHYKFERTEKLKNNLYIGKINCLKNDICQLTKYEGGVLYIKNNKKKYYLRHLKGKQYDKNGNLIIEGIWGSGKFIRGKAILSNGTYNGKFLNGEFLNGEFKGTFTNKDGHIYVGEWKNGEMTGQGTCTLRLKNGDIYVGGWKNNEKSGQGKYTWKNGRTYVGGWKNNLFNGQGTKTLKNGSKYVGEWKNGKQNGLGTYTWKNGSKYVGGWKNSKRNGLG
jgi:hypothetical protein